MTELSYRRCSGFKQGGGRQMPLGGESLPKARLARLFAGGVRRSGDAIGLQHEEIVRRKVHVFSRGIPCFK